MTGDRVAYAPFQEVGERLPGIREEAFAEAVHLVEPEGRISRGAEAVFRALSYAPGRGGWLWAYRHVPAFRGVSEACYRFIASRRPFFDRVTSWLWGAHVVPPGERLTSWVYLGFLGVIYLVAFLSLWTQVSGLIGRRGILPAAETLHAIASSENLGPSRFWQAPTLCWVSSADGFLVALCAGGVALAFALIAGFCPVPCLLGLWAAYLSLATVCREFLWFQWDGLILEAGFLACFLAPWGMRSRPRTGAVESRGALRMTRWLLFRLLLGSAAVKITSGDPTWRQLTALSFHYETQPLPTGLAWYVHQLPLGFHRASAAGTFLIEGLVPFLIFGPRRVRFVAAALIAAHQLAIAATGNYGFFNLLTLALCVPLLDDAVWPRALRARGPRIGADTRPRAVPAWIRRPVLLALFLLSLVPLWGAFRWSSAWLGPLRELYVHVAPFRTVNHYGLFAIMTTQRPEILMEGSADGRVWKTYEFRFKPGDPNRAPGFVAPHQPRLDWQMWFAALSDYRNEYWFLSFCDKLLRNSRPVVGLLHTNPFPDAPPRYVRAVVYRYRFTDPETRRATGAWWKREPVGLYCPVLMLEGDRLTAAPQGLQAW